MLNCTWDDLEAEMVLRKLEVPLEEQRRLQSYYLKLREQYRDVRNPPNPANPDIAADL